MSQKLVLGNHLVPEILAHLGKLAALPEQGLLAGQALASAIMDIYGAGGGVYNDIDVFLPASPEKLAVLASDERLTEDALTLGLPRAVLDNYQALSLDSEEELRLAGSEQHGLINLIWCNTEEFELTPGRLVHSFDLNAVEVALDLQHKELTWTRAFEEFLSHRELEVTSLAAPERTLLRYLKKRSELGVFGNDELVLDMVATWRVDVVDDPAILATKMLTLAKQFMPQLASRFEIDDNTLAVRLNWAAPAHLQDLAASCQTDYAEAGGLTRLVPLLAYARSKQATQEQTQYAAALAETFAEHNGDSCWENVVHLGATLAGGAYVRGQRSATHEEAVLRALAKHSGLNSALMGLTLEEQYRCVLDLAKRAKGTAGLTVYGLAETVATPVDMWNAHHRDQFFRQMEREVPGGELCQSFFPDFSEGGWVIRELRTKSALRMEGLAMAHCVGGYASAVKAGRSRILAIRHKDQAKWASTAELSGSFRAKGLVRVAQHRSYSNRSVAPETTAVLEKYLDVQSAAMGFELQKRCDDPFSFLVNMPDRAL